MTQTPAAGLTPAQQEQLLKPINPSRVKSLDGMSHLEAWDVRAHLIRVFGFGGFSVELLDVTPVYEQEVQLRSGKPGFKVGYRATVRLTIHSLGAVYTEAAFGESQMPDFKRGDAHDMAIKTAESQALKRAAINLGTQFGLSLYQNGSTADVVRVTLVGPTAAPAEHVEKAVEQVGPVASEDGSTVDTETGEATPAEPGITDEQRLVIEDLRATTWAHLDDDQWLKGLRAHSRPEVTTVADLTVTEAESLTKALTKKPVRKAA